jgi:hypothetical protein
LANHKFCNVYRILDKTSQYCVSRIINAGPQHPQELLFRVSLFKYFNRIATWELLERNLGVLERGTFDYRKYSQVLDTAYHKGEHLFGSAYRANQKYRLDLEGTHLRYLALLKFAMESVFRDRLLGARSYQECFWVLRGLPLHGDFVGMQILTDLNYSALLAFDENDYVRPGPGCVNGINVCFGTRLSDKSVRDMRWPPRWFVILPITKSDISKTWGYSRSRCLGSGD